jgi:hypothetical protein
LRPPPPQEGASHTFGTTGEEETVTSSYYASEQQTEGKKMNWRMWLNVKLSLCLNKHYDEYAEVEEKLDDFLTSVFMDASYNLHRQAALIPGKSPQSQTGRGGEEKFLPLPGIEPRTSKP